MLSFIVKIEKVDGVPQHDDMNGVVDKMRFLLIVFGVCQHDKPYEPQDPIYVMNGLKMLESVIFIEFVELDWLIEEIGDADVGAVGSCDDVHVLFDLVFLLLIDQLHELFLGQSVFSVHQSIFQPIEKSFLFIGDLWIVHLIATGLIR